jgi:ribosomal protein S6--L-glutamate ligase
MKIHFFLNERVHAEPNPIFAEAILMLGRRGYAVSSWIAEEQLCPADDFAVDNDLYVLKSQTELSLSLAGILHHRGAHILNPYPACAALQNKIVAANRLAQAGVPLPRSWVTGDLRLLRDLVSRMPLIAKPYHGHRGAGIRVLRTPDEVLEIARPEQPMLVQEYIPNSGADLKIYVIGGEVFGVRKPFSETSFTGTGVPCAVSLAVRDIALRCGRAFGLGMYGLDLVEGPDGPVVVDLNFSPGFRGVPDAASYIARYIEDYACGRRTLPIELEPLGAPRAPQPPRVPFPGWAAA